MSYGWKFGVINSVNREELDPKENLILSKLEESPYLSAKSMSEELNIPFRSVQRYFSNLKEKGFIERVGSNKNGYWKVIKWLPDELIIRFLTKRKEDSLRKEILCMKNDNRLARLLSHI